MMRYISDGTFVLALVFLLGIVLVLSRWSDNYNIPQVTDKAERAQQTALADALAYLSFAVTLAAIGVILRVW